MTITPEDAIDILDRNYSEQRNVKASTVAKFAYLMMAGEWDPYRGDLIRMTRDGILIGGQHRLTAVVESEVTCEFLFCDSFDLKDFSYIDAGVTRTAADALVGTQSKTSTAALLKALINWNERGISWSRLFIAPRDNGTIAESLQRFGQAAVEQAISDGRKLRAAMGKRGSEAAFTLFAYLAKKADEQEFEELLLRSRDDTDLVAEKVYLMRAAAQKKRIEPMSMLSILATMWNDHLDGTVRKVIRANPGNVRMYMVNVTWNGTLLERFER